MNGNASPDISRERIDALWNDLANWKWGVIYRCREDPRAIVPRRWRWGGWTLNFAHPRAGLVGLLAFCLAVGPATVAILLSANAGAAIIVMLISIVALIAWSHLESSRTG